jgi:AsmA family protein
MNDQAKCLRHAARSSLVFLRHPLLTILIVAVPVLAWTWDWDWLRPLIEDQASAAMGRAVHITHFAVKDFFSRTPLLVADGITIDNPADFPEGGHVGTIDRLSIRVDAAVALESYGADIVLPEIAVDHAEGNLRRGPKGDPNWALSAPASTGNPPRIGALAISDGHVRIVNPKLKSDFTITIHTEDQAGDREPHVVALAHGTYAGAPITAEFVGDSLLSLRDPARPYSVVFRAANGATRIALHGTIVDPMRLDGAHLTLDLAGKNLADLYQVLGVPLAPTAPYHLTGQLDYADGRVRFRDFSGTVGNSDLEGDFAVEPGLERPRITADLTSKRVVLADLAGFIGAAPGEAYDPNLSSQQQIEHTQQSASPKLIPDTPINLPEVRAADFRVHYKAQRIDSQATPLDNLEANLTIENGDIALHPLSFGIGKGEISSDINFHSQHGLVHAKAAADFRRVDLRRIMETTRVFEGAGVIGGHAEMDSTGNSLSELLGHGDGYLRLFMTDGDISTLLVDLAGLDFGSALRSALKLPDKTDIRCLIGDFGLEKGVLKTRALVFDTKEANIVGTGWVNLKDESLQYQLTQEPKHFSIGAFHAPIDISGYLKSPSVGPDTKQLSARAAASVALGVLLTPLGALLPTVQLGLGPNNDCQQLLGSSQTTIARSPSSFRLLQ